MAPGNFALGPYAYVGFELPGYDASPGVYLDTAAAEAGAIMDLFTKTVPGEWPAGSVVLLASRLLSTVYSARLALEGRNPDRVAREFVAVALLWKHLRDRAPEVRARERDAQREATRSGEERAEEQLRALASVGERVVGVDWRAQAEADFHLTGRAALRVWDAVAKSYPYLSSSKGKPKVRRN